MGLYQEGHNSFRLFSTPNQFSMNLLNPFHPMVTMLVTIKYPLLPDIDDDTWKDIPSFDLSDFLGYCSLFRELLEDENSTLYPIYTLYRALAINNIQWGNIKDELNWRFLVAHYIGHYLTLVLDDLRDMEGRYTLDSEQTVTKQYTVEELRLVSSNEFLATPYGIRFWNIYKIYGRMVWKGARHQRGRY